MTLTCTKCKETKDTSGFYVNFRYSSGYETICKACRAEYNRLYRERHKDYDKQYKRRMRRAQKEGTWAPKKYNRVTPR